MFNEARTAEAAAYLLEKAGRTMPKMKLHALIYLADREKYDDYGSSITKDTIITTEHGPMLQNTTQLINQNNLAINTWNNLIYNDKNGTAILRYPYTEDEYWQISKAIIIILDKTYKQFEHLNEKDLIKYLQTLPEWKYPENNLLEITPKDIFIALNKDEKTINTLLYYLENENAIDRWASQTNQVQ